VEGVAEALLPEACVSCDEVLAEGERERAFCRACWPEVAELPSVCCPRCSQPGAFRQLCPRCEELPRTFTRAWAPFEHEGAIARAVHRFKYSDRADLARPLGALLARRAAAELRVLPGTLVPIPLHARRFRERQFDQAALLALELSRRSGRPAAPEVLEWVRHTSRQVRLEESEREANVRGAFAVRRGVAGADLVLVDDVMTTGATVREAAAVLLSDGARTVSVLCLARASRDLPYR